MIRVYGHGGHVVVVFGFMMRSTEMEVGGKEGGELNSLILKGFKGHSEGGAYGPPHIVPPCSTMQGPGTHPHRLFPCPLPPPPSPVVRTRQGWRRDQSVEQ